MAIMIGPENRRLISASINWRWIAIVLIPLTASLGPYLLPINIASFNVYAFRSLLIATLIFLFVTSKGFVLIGGPISRNYFYLGYLWLVWGIASSIWSPDINAAIIELVAICLGFTVGFVLLNLVAHSENKLHALRIGWVLAYIVSASIAIWEMITGQHLPGYFMEYGAGFVLDNTVMSTFGHPNNFAAFLVICFPFLLWSIYVSKGITRLFYLLLLVGLPYLLVMTCGRLSIIAVTIQSLLFIAMVSKGLKSFFRGILIVLLIMFVLSFSLQVNVFTSSKFGLLSNELQTGGSAAIRTNLVLNGVWFSIISYGLGTGAGSFEHMVEHGHGLYPTGHIINPHNFWIEILAQYGIIIFIGFVMWFLRIAFIALRIRRNAKKNNDTNMCLVAEIILISLLGYVFAAVANSSYINQPVNWSILGSILVMVSFINRQDILRPHRI